MLEAENQKLISQVVSLQAINDANAAQTISSLSSQNLGFNLRIAGVIGLDGSDMLSVNKGSVDGIAVGMPVISQQNVLFGLVAKVFKNYSEVQLISSPDSVVNVKVQQNSDDASVNQSEVDGVIKGSGNLSLYLDLVPIGTEINQGDVLITSALEKKFPKDLLVGTISHVEKNDQKPFQQAQVQPFFNLNNTDNLFIITNYKQN